jgi:hypothetical protein
LSQRTHVEAADGKVSKFLETLSNRTRFIKTRSV